MTALQVLQVPRTALQVLKQVLLGTRTLASTEAQESDETEDEATGERTTRVGRPRGGMKVAARSGERLRREIGRGRLPRVGDG